MAEREQVSHSELESHLREQLQFLKASCESFDKGFDGESKRLAVTIRVLVHDTQHSKSLLQQLGKIGSFLDSATPLDPANLAPYGGLINVVMEPRGVRYIAPLDFAYPPPKMVLFDQWWLSAVFVDTKRQRVSRKDLVLTAANQDGGAHVDPMLDKKYTDLAKRNSMGTFRETPGGIEPIPSPERAAIRQIAHEVLKTLEPDYRKDPEPIHGLAIAGISLKPDFHLPPKMSRNQQCYCGSGRKYKHCHGRF